MEEQDIKITVWCLAYNHEKYIRMALDGFVGQKASFKFEVIVHDDASTDKTPDIIKEYAVQYPAIIKPIFQSENQYQKHNSITLNFMLPKTKGKYIALCEGDDYWSDPYKLQKQYDVLCSNSDVHMCVHKVECINEDGSLNEKTIPNKRLGLNKNMMIDPDELSDLLYIKSTYPFHTSSYMFEKKLIEDDRFSQLSGHMNGDQIYLRRGLVYGGVYYLNEVMSKRRLMSVDGYNYRLRNKDTEYRSRRLLDRVHGHIMFDNLTNKSYHDKIIDFCYKRICKAASMDYDRSRAFAIEFRNTYPYKHKYSLKTTIEVFMLMHCDPVMKYWYKMKKCIKRLSVGGN